jgi:two-component system chemotaxis response regulator CheY
MSKIRLLVVDDDALLRRSLNLQLTRAGYEVHEAEDGQTAWEMIEREGTRFVITDWNMPGLSGPELVQRIREAGLPGYTYIMMLTAHSEKPDVVAGLQSGADDYLTKPFDMDELRARVAIGARILALESRLTESRNSAAELAVRDGLTALYNRRAFDERLADEVQRAVRYQRPLSLLMIDIDNFKMYNDRHGHPQGDVLLRELSSLFLGCVRSTDFVARYGGEEFTVILPETAAANAAAVAGTILERVCAYPFAGRETQPGGALTVSIGVAGHDDSQPEPARLLSAADQALYRAKGLGRNRVVGA